LYLQQAGNFDTLVYAGKDWTDVQIERKSMILLAEKFPPIVNDAVISSAVAP
jgi:hypothetical protein